MTGFDGPTTIARAAAIASSASRGRAGGPDPVQGDVLDRAGRPFADHELLEAVPAGRVADVGADRLVAHRQHAGRDAERPAGLVDRLGQRRALRQPAGAAQAQGQVAVAEVEPDALAELAQPVHDRERVAGQSPAALVDAPGEPERDEIGVGGDVGAVDLDVVAGVGDHHQLVADLLLQAPGELGAAGPAGQEDYHGRSVSPVRRMPACVL